MANVLILSSFVAHGHVGLSAGQPVLQALGHRVTALPTVVLSNHPGLGATSGFAVPVDDLRGMIDALDKAGVLAAQDAVLTGYLPSAAHVALACELIARMRPARVVVDPVLGDRPRGLYLPQDVAEAMRDRLAPKADILTPNLFELGWLTGRATDTLTDARAAARTLAPGVLLTSPPLGAEATGLLDLRDDGATIWRLPALHGVPHGTGDVFAALIAAGLAPGAALGHLACLIGDSLGAAHLRIAETAPRWTRAAPLQPET